MLLDAISESQIEVEMAVKQRREVSLPPAKLTELATITANTEYPHDKEDPGSPGHDEPVFMRTTDAKHTTPLTNLALASMVAAGIQFGWALQLSLLTPYIQVSCTNGRPPDGSIANLGQPCTVQRRGLQSNLFAAWHLINSFMLSI